MAGLIGASGISGCLGSITGGGEIPTLRLGWIAPTGFPSPFGVPELQEELDNLGEAYEVELTRNQSTPDGLNKLAAGELDTTTAAYSSFPGAVTTTSRRPTLRSWGPSATTPTPTGSRFHGSPSPSPVSRRRRTSRARRSA